MIHFTILNHAVDSKSTHGSKEIENKLTINKSCGTRGTINCNVSFDLKTWRVAQTGARALGKCSSLEQIGAVSAAGAHPLSRAICFCSSFLISASVFLYCSHFPRDHKNMFLLLSIVIFFLLASRRSASRATITSTVVTFT